MWPTPSISSTVTRGKVLASSRATPLDEAELERAVALADDGQPLGPAHLLERIAAGAAQAPVVQTLNDAVEALKRRMIEDALRECGSKTQAAERLGLTRQSLQQMLRRRQ